MTAVDVPHFSLPRLLDVGQSLSSNLDSEPVAYHSQNYRVGSPKTTSARYCLRERGKPGRRSAPYCRPGSLPPVGSPLFCLLGMIPRRPASACSVWDPRNGPHQKSDRAIARLPYYGLRPIVFFGICDSSTTEVSVSVNCPPEGTK